MVQTIVLCVPAIRDQDVNPCIQQTGGRIGGLTAYSVVSMDSRCLRCESSNPSPTPPSTDGSDDTNGPGGNHSHYQISTHSYTTNGANGVHIRH